LIRAIIAAADRDHGRITAKNAAVIDRILFDLHCKSTPVSSGLDRDFITTRQKFRKVIGKANALFFNTRHPRSTGFVAIYVD